MTAVFGRLREFARAAQLLRPRTIASLEKSHSRLLQTVEQLSADVRLLTQQLREIGLREQQLRAVLRADAALAGESAGLDDILRDPALESHVRGAIAAAPLEREPFPYCVVDNLLPDRYYDALITGLPPIELFADRPTNKQQLVVPFELAPEYSRRIWQHMVTVVANHVIAPAVAETFREPLQRWLRDAFPNIDSRRLEGLPLKCSDGRVLLRRRGYRIPPHRDPKWGFITCLFYLARPDDDQRWGTQLYSVDGDEEARDAKPHWISDAQCRLARDVPFRRNRMLIFLNSVGAHGACIPADAEPAEMERYAYQFRVGPHHRAFEAIIAKLPPEQRALWAGKVTDY